MVDVGVRGDVTELASSTIKPQSPALQAQITNVILTAIS